MVLSTYKSDNVPVLINYDGGIYENFKFELGKDTEVKYSCSAVLNGEFFVFGGSYKKDQVR